MPAEKLQPILDSVVNNFNYIVDENIREEFRSTLQSYIRLYGYISQIIDWGVEDLEKLYVFARNLNRKLPKRKSKPLEIEDSVDLDSFRVQKTFDEIQIPLEKENGTTGGIGTGIRKPIEDEKDFLSNLIKTLNDIYSLDLSEDDKVDIERMQIKLRESEELLAVMNSSNTRENIKYKFYKVLEKIILEFHNDKLGLYQKLTDPNVNELLKKRWFDVFYSKMRMERGQQTFKW